MRSIRTVLNLACVWLSFAASVEMHAQHASAAVPLVTRAPKEATQYDFLLGQWDLTVTPKAASSPICSTQAGPPLAWKKRYTCGPRL